MEITTKLYQAILTAQKMFGAVLKDSNNPMFKSKYASLESVLDAVRQPLLDAGVLVMQPTFDNGERDEKGAPRCACIKTVLIHAESGESMEVVTTVPVSKSDAQGYGSALTYARRYAIMGILGLAPEDDDANAATGAKPQQQTTARQQSGSTRSGQSASRSRTDTSAQRPASAQGSQATATTAQPTLESAMKKIAATEPHRLDFAKQWIQVHFSGDDLIKLSEAIEAHRKAQTAA
jgi:hypothetical protein